MIILTPAQFLNYFSFFCLTQQEPAYIQTSVYLYLLCLPLFMSPPTCTLFSELSSYRSIKYEKDSVSLEERGVVLGCPRVVVCDAIASGPHPSLTEEASGQRARGDFLYTFTAVCM